MTRRRQFIARVSAYTALALGVLIVGTGMVMTRSDFGREQLRRMVERQLAGAVKGSVHVGRIGGNLLTEVTVDSFAIRDAEGVLFASTGRTRVRLDPRDLLDRRIRLELVETENPRVYLRDYGDGDWNYKRIFQRSKSAPRVRSAAQAWGDHIMIEHARGTNGSFVLEMPWTPDDSLRGAQRDSAVREHLERPDGSYREVSPGQYTHVLRWTRGMGVLSHARLAHPDSAGRLFVIDTLHVEEHEPPFSFRNVAATVRQLADSAWLEVRHWDTPGSTGRAHGKVVWGSDLPTRYDIRVFGDSVSLADVAWVYPTLPRTGGGTMVLDIRNDSSNLRVMNYALSQMDVRSTGSRLLGSMTFSVGGPVLAVRDVDLRAQPVDFDLVRTLNGMPFPVDWQGTITGTVAGRGGPLNRFVVDRSDVVYRDKHVRGASAHLRGRGELDILDPANTTFRGFHVDAVRADLRTIEFLYPNFPRLGGTVSGVATLDSSWLDVRFRDARLAHTNGPGEPTRVAGSGRVTWGEQFMTYDIAVQADSLSMNMMRRAYPMLPLRGMFAGPIRATGTVENLALNTRLTGPAGAFTFDGTVDVFAPGYRAQGLATVEALDASRLFVSGTAPRTMVGGRFDLDVRADSTAHGWQPGGRAGLALDRSEFDGMRISPSTGTLRFADGRAWVDSLLVESSAMVVRANGALGLRPGIADSLVFEVIVDSLGGLRRYLVLSAAEGRLGSAAADSAAMTVPPDSLAGSVVLTGVAIGSTESLALRGTAKGERLAVGGIVAKSMTGSFDVRDVLRGGIGGVTMRLDSVIAAGVQLDSVRAAVDLQGASTRRFALHAASETGPAAAMTGSWSRVDSASTIVRLDTATIQLEEGASWRLAHAAVLRQSAAGTALDSLLLVRHSASGTTGASSLSIWGSRGDTLALHAAADSVPLADLSELAQRAPLGGVATARWSLTGIESNPVMRADARLRELQYGSVRISQLDARGDYEDERLQAQLDYYLDPQSARPAVSATASLPMQLSPAGVRLLEEDSLRVGVRADDAELTLLEALNPGLRNAKGTFSARLDVAGSKARPLVSGGLLVQGGELSVLSAGLHLRGIIADVEIVPGTDSLVVRRLVAQSGRAADTASVRGFVSFRDFGNPYFDLRLDARTFQALDRRSLARLTVSTGAGGVQLTGPMSGSMLTGSVRVDKGVVYIPDVRTRDVQPLSGDDFLAIIDTTDLLDRALLPKAPSALVEHVQLDGVRVTLGDDVWLRSAEANVKLGGSLSVTRVRDLLDRSRRDFSQRGASDTSGYRLALEGSLHAERGTYLLDLGVLGREFQVVEGGTITFYGTADLNPTLDISALYRVKQVDRPEIGVRARLTGPLYPQPTLQLESAENYSLSQSDLVSYLVTGRPSLDYAFRDDLSQSAVDVILPTLNAYGKARLRSQFGSWVDALQLETGAAHSTGESNLLMSGITALSNSRVSWEMQLQNNLFFNVGGGICSLYSGWGEGEQSIENLTSTLSAKIVKRFPQSLSVQAGREPQTSSLNGCSATNNVRGAIPTPSQWGLSVSRSWRF